MSNILSPIIGGINIAKFMKCSLPTFHRRHSNPMKQMGLLWKQDGRSNAKLVTTPFFISIYWYHQALMQNDEKEFLSKVRENSKAR